MRDRRRALVARMRRVSAKSGGPVPPDCRRHGVTYMREWLRAGRGTAGRDSIARSNSGAAFACRAGKKRKLGGGSVIELDTAVPAPASPPARMDATGKLCAALGTVLAISTFSGERRMAVCGRARPAQRTLGARSPASPLFGPAIPRRNALYCDGGRDAVGVGRSGRVPPCARHRLEGLLGDPTAFDARRHNPDRGDRRVHATLGSAPRAGACRHAHAPATCSYCSRNGGGSRGRANAARAAASPAGAPAFGPTKQRWCSSAAGSEPSASPMRCSRADSGGTFPSCGELGPELGTSHLAWGCRWQCLLYGSPRLSRRAQMFR